MISEFYVSSDYTKEEVGVAILIKKDGDKMQVIAETVCRGLDKHSFAAVVAAMAEANRARIIQSN